MFFKHALSVISAALLIVPIAVQAKRVEPQQAEELAQRFVEDKRISRQGGKVRLKHAGVKRGQRANASGGALRKQSAASAMAEDTLYYIFNFDETEGGGFVIVSADDVAMPVLGYSTNGAYDEEDVPPNFAYWIDYLARQIEFARENELSLSYSAQAAWDASSDFTPTRIIGDTLKTKWWQNAPYNNIVNSVYGGDNATGCVATAMAQIMKYHEWPIQATGNHPRINFDSLNVKYDWKNMLNEYPISTQRTVQNDAVALLMHHVGESVLTDYGSQSGASVWYVRFVLSQYFGYDDASRQLERVTFRNEDEWHKVLKASLDNKMPIIYSGRRVGIAGDHTFVCDAYDEGSDRFHFNWGWGGNYDGWYLTNVLSPQAELGVYSDQQEVLVNIKRWVDDGRYDLVGKFKISKTHEYHEAGGYTYIGDVPITEVIHGEVFYGGNFAIHNTSAMKVFPGGEYGVALVNSSGKIESIIGSPITTNGSIRTPGLIPNPGTKYFYGSINGVAVYNGVCAFSVPTSVPAGKYKLKLAYRLKGDGDNDWVQVSDVGKFTNDSSDVYDFTVLPNDNITSKFTDPVFRAAVYERINKADGDPIYRIDLSGISILNIKEKGIKNLDGIEYFTTLKTLDCSGNNLTSLDVSKNVFLETLDCSNNKLSSLNVSGYKLRVLTNSEVKPGYSGNLPALVTTVWTEGATSTSLKELNCSNNNISMLDVSAIPITKLDIRNNYLMSHSFLNGLPKNCELLSSPQKTDISSSFTDVNFRAAVYEALGKKNGDPISPNDVSYLTTLRVSDKSIKSLAGIENLIYLGTLECDNNDLTELDLSNNTLLSKLICNNNNLTKLNVSNNTQLRELHCGNNELTELDISNSSMISKLDCSNNSLQSLTFPNQSKTPTLQAIDYINCSNNRLTELDLATLILVKNVDCRNNYLMDLKLPQLHVFELNCSYNNLSRLVLNSLPEYKIERLICNDNYLVSTSAIMNAPPNIEWDNDEDFLFTPQKEQPELVVSEHFAERTIIGNYGSGVHLVTFLDASGETIRLQLVQTGKSAYPPKITLDDYTLEWDKDYSNITEDMVITAQWAQALTTAIQTQDRIVPEAKPNNDAAVIMPTVILSGELTVGPNPVSKQSGAISIFRQGYRIERAKLAVYDASGNLVKKLSVKDNDTDEFSKRKVGMWDLKDRKGKLVADGTYLIKGTLTVRSGKKEKVSVLVGVR